MSGTISMMGDRAHEHGHRSGRWPRSGNRKTTFCRRTRDCQTFPAGRCWGAGRTSRERRARCRSASWCRLCWSSSTSEPGRASCHRGRRPGPGPRAGEGSGLTWSVSGTGQETGRGGRQCWSGAPSSGSSSSGSAPNQTKQFLAKLTDSGMPKWPVLLGQIGRPCSAKWAEHVLPLWPNSSIRQNIVRQKKIVRFGSAETGFGRSLMKTRCSAPNK